MFHVSLYFRNFVKALDVEIPQRLEISIDQVQSALLNLQEKSKTAVFTTEKHRNHIASLPSQDLQSHSSLKTEESRNMNPSISFASPVAADATNKPVHEEPLTIRAAVGTSVLLQQQYGSSGPLVPSNHVVSQDAEMFQRVEVSSRIPLEKVIDCLDGVFSSWGRTGYVLTRTAALLSKLMRRTQADDVTEELRLPPVTVNTFFLEFTSIEKYFYQVIQQIKEI